MVKRENSREYVVREGHRLRRGLQHHFHNLLHVANEETIRGSSDSLLGKMVFNSSGCTPEQDYNLDQKNECQEGDGKQLNEPVMIQEQLFHVKRRGGGA